MRYRNEHEIAEVIRTFEDASVARDEWDHAGHLTVALHYLCLHNIEVATAKLRDGLLRLLRVQGVDLTKEMPYHETITVFWMHTIADFNASRNGTSLLDKANELIANYGKDYPLKYYSRDLLFSDEARTSFLEGDL